MVKAKGQRCRKMKKNVLICEDSIEIGKAIAEKIKKRKIETFVIENNIFKIKERFTSFKYDAVVINPIGDMERYYRLIKILSADYPNMQIITISYSNNPEEQAKLLAAGVDRCLIMPMKISKIIDYIVVQLVCAEHKEIMPEMAGFLVESGFNDCKKAGFFYLCMALELGVAEPARLNSLMTDIYGEIGNRLGTNASCVERTIRYLVEHAGSGIIEYITNGERKDGITNGALISILCGNYIKSRDIILLKAQ